MRVALRAVNLGAAHEPAVVFFRFHVFGRSGLPERWPAGAGFEFRVGRIGGLAAAHAGVRALDVMVRVNAGERTFGAVFAGNFELLSRKLSAPLSVGFVNFFHDVYFHLKGAQSATNFS